MSVVNLTEKSDYEGRKINIYNLNILPIFTKKWFDRVESFVKQEHEEYSIFKLIPKHTNVKDVLEHYDAYVFVAKKDGRMFLRDIGGSFIITPDLLDYMELVESN